MGNIPLQGGSSAVDEIDKNLKKVLYHIHLIYSVYYTPFKSHLRFILTCSF